MSDSNAEFLRTLAAALSVLGHDDSITERLRVIAVEMDALDALISLMGI